ncbi:1070_t:CDS:2 [Rhizophagus irregularis]|nr:1070_t:CDS:2 [Rhizophagus irregularis]
MEQDNDNANETLLGVEYINCGANFPRFITYKYAKAHCNQPRNQSKRKLQVMENKEQKEIISVNYNSKILFSSDDVIYSTDEILEPLKHLGKGGPSSKRL